MRNIILLSMLLIISGCAVFGNEKNLLIDEVETHDIEDDSLVPFIEFEQYELDNGITVILHEDHSTPIASVVVMYHVGSKDEMPGKTGFAHLFEHMMFEGSLNVPDGEHFLQLQEVGAGLNGQTYMDWTRYYETGPSNFLELALFLEADRMGNLLPVMTQEKLDLQRDVVKNERRQRVDNAPYGTAWETIDAALYPEGHPYSWPIIGYMEDLSGATLDDVESFFRTYYSPGNAVLVITGDIDPDQTKAWVEQYFGSIPRGPDIERPKSAPVVLEEDKLLILEDNVQVPRLYLTWPTAEDGTRKAAMLEIFSSIMGGGKSSRLQKILVQEKQIAQSVSVGQSSDEIAGKFQIIVTGKPGQDLDEIQDAVDEALQQAFAEGVSDEEIQKTMNALESGFIDERMTSLDKALLLGMHHTFDEMGAINKPFDEYHDATPKEVTRAAKEYLDSKRVVLSVVPYGMQELASGGE